MASIGFNIEDVTQFFKNNSSNFVRRQYLVSSVINTRHKNTKGHKEQFCGPWCFCAFVFQKGIVLLDIHYNYQKLGPRF